MADVEYSASLDTRFVEESLSKITLLLTEIAIQGAESFDKVGDAAEKAGNQAEEAGDKFEGSGKRGKKAGKEIILTWGDVLDILGKVGQAIDLTFESLGGVRAERAFRRLSAGFGQDADQILDSLERVTRGTIDRTTLISTSVQALQSGLARTPEEFERVAAAAVTLGSVSPNVNGAAEALERFVLGVSKRETELLDEFGISAGVINTELERLAQVQFGKTSQQLTQAQRDTLFFEAAVNVATQRAERLGGVAEDAGTSLERLAAQGKNARQEVGELGLVLAAIADQAADDFGAEGGFAGLVEAGVDRIKLALIDLASLSFAFFKTFQRGIEIFVAEPLTNVAIGIGRVLKGEVDGIRDLARGPQIAGAGRDLFDTFFGSFFDRQQELKGDLQEVLDPTAAGEGVAPFAPDVSGAIDDEAQKAEEAQQKLNERLTELAIQAQQDLLKIQIDGERDRIDQLRKFAQAREDIARKNLQKLVDISAADEDRREDQATAQGRKLEDIQKKFDRDRAESQTQRAKDELAAEEAFNEALFRIRQRFLFDAQEAERRNDVQAFLAARRRANQEIQEAQRTRTQAIDQSARSAEERRAELKKNLDQEVEDARIANQRKSEDLDTRLARDLEKQRLANEREILDQTIKERRLEEERNIAFEREIQDFNRKERQKLAAFIRSNQQEIQLIKSFEAQKRQVRIEETERTIQAVNERLARIPFAPRIPGLPGSNLLTAPPNLATAGAGGPVTNNNVNNTFTVGDPGNPLQAAQLSNVVNESLLGILG